MKKNSTIIVGALFVSAALGTFAAEAKSASDAVTHMAKKDAEIQNLRKIHEETLQKLKDEMGNKIDLTTTATVKSSTQFDARGVVIPNSETTIGAGIAATIKSLPFKSGQSFLKGEQLVSFDCARQNAELRGSEARLSKAASLFKGKQRLKARGAAGGQEVLEAKSDMLAAQASVDGLRAVISLCSISAPFDGRVVERHAEAFEIPAANAPVLTIVDDSALELDLIVPSSWLRWVQAGSEFDFAVDELGETYQARVLRLGAKVDAVSQTIKITGAFVKRPKNVLAGMSGTATFIPPTN